jgi:hypothetical protein
VADIKALMSVGDATADLKAGTNPLSWRDVTRMRREADASPLLLLYPIDRVSPPQTEGGVRIQMDAITDILGMGIVFAETRGGAGQFVSVQLPVIEPDDQDEDDTDGLDLAELFDTSADDTDE